MHPAVETSYYIVILLGFIQLSGWSIPGPMSSSSSSSDSVDHTGRGSNVNPS